MAHRLKLGFDNYSIRALNWKTAEGNKESGNVQVGLGSVAFSGRF